jgi:hypothetical protein
MGQNGHLVDELVNANGNIMAARFHTRTAADTAVKYAILSEFAYKEAVNRYKANAKLEFLQWGMAQRAWEYQRSLGGPLDKI